MSYMLTYLDAALTQLDMTWPAQVAQYLRGNERKQVLCIKMSVFYILLFNTGT